MSTENTQGVRTSIYAHHSKASTSNDTFIAGKQENFLRATMDTIPCGLKVFAFKHYVWHFCTVIIGKLTNYT